MNKEKVLRKTKEYLVSINDSDIDEKMKIMDHLLSIKKRKEFYSTLYEMENLP